MLGGKAVVPLQVLRTRPPELIGDTVSVVLSWLDSRFPSAYDLNMARGVEAVMAQVDPDTFVVNLAMILGAIFVLLGVFVASIATITAIRCLLWTRARRIAEEEHRRQTRRADGKPYPARTEGQCTKCKRGDRTIYMAGGGNELCPTCYETYWRMAEGWNDGAKQVDISGDEVIGERTQ